MRSSVGGEASGWAGALCWRQGATLETLKGPEVRASLAPRLQGPTRDVFYFCHRLSSLDFSLLPRQGHSRSQGSWILPGLAQGCPGTVPMPPREPQSAAPAPGNVSLQTEQPLKLAQKEAAASTGVAPWGASRAGRGALWCCSMWEPGSPESLVLPLQLLACGTEL